MQIDPIAAGIAGMNVEDLQNPGIGEVVGEESEKTLGIGTIETGDQEMIGAMTNGMMADLKDPGIGEKIKGGSGIEGKSLNCQ